MVNTYAPSDSRETFCPSCGAVIKAPPSPRRRRVQCPKCREVVVIESREEPAPAAAKRTVRTPDADAAEQSRLDSLEARVAALEAILAQSHAQTPSTIPGIPMQKLQWVAGPGERAADFSPEQAKALVHNLGTVKSKEITIRAPAGDRIASEHALWFKSAFERAGWKVRGPEEIEPHSAERALSLAVPELPVGQDAAATYLALKAAGFETVPILDSPPSSGKGSPLLSLTLPPARAA